VDFARVLDTIAVLFEREGVRFGVIGAFGLHAYGLTRATLDLDLVTEAAAQPAVVAFLESLGYETLYRSAGYSNHVHAMPALGRVDVMYVDTETSRILFGGCGTLALPSGRQVPVPRPEHLVAMKVQAMKNNPRRTHRDLADIQDLLELPGIDVGEVRGYFERAGLLERFDELRRPS
jgi:hypothetical protein